MLWPLLPQYLVQLPLLLLLLTEPATENNVNNHFFLCLSTGTTYRFQ